MKIDALQLAASYSKARKRRKRWHMVVTCMAAVVVFCTAYALLLPAITQERPRFCGLEEHTHSAECYQYGAVAMPCDPSLHIHDALCYGPDGELVCDYGEVIIHSHNELCYDSEGNLRCGYNEVFAHVHNDGCYAQGELLCTTETIAHDHDATCYAAPVLSCCIEECTGHHHDAACYAQGDLLCGLDMDETHHHDETCYAEPFLTCALEECGGHHHGEGCYTQGELLCELGEQEPHCHDESCYAAPVLICSVPELIVHRHNATCIASGCTLPVVTEHTHNEACTAMPELITTCGMEEHTHNDNCYIDRTIDVESPENWEATIPEELNGQWAEDALAIAISQLGYRESEANILITEEGVCRGYTRYGQWYGDPYGDWCAMFASFCFHYAQVDNEFLPFEAHCQRWIDLLTEKDLYYPSGTRVITPGDLIFFDYEGDGNANHVGLVLEILPAEEDAPAQVKTIEGNHSNSVGYGQYDITDEKIMGYGAVTTAQKNYKLAQSYSQTYSDQNVVVEVTYAGETMVPEEAVLSVTPIMPGADNVYDVCYQQTEELLQMNDSQIRETTVNEFLLYDIRFLLDGREIQPEAPVDIRIRFKSAGMKEKQNMTVIHYADDGTQIPQQEYALDDGVLSVELSLDKFAPFAIVSSKTEVKSIVSFAPVALTQEHLLALDGQTYMIAGDNFALAVKQGELLTSKALQALPNAGKSGEEPLGCWEFVKSGGSNYYVRTQQGGNSYYLGYVDDALVLLTEQESAMLFTAACQNGNLTLSYNGGYLHVDGEGVYMAGQMELGLFTIPNGEFTATFDGQLGMQSGKYSAVEVFERKTTDGYLTLPSADEVLVPTDYAWKLNGWYDIINKVFYDSSMFGKEIRLTNNTIFYPEWIPASYDIGKNANVIHGQPDTSGFISTYVYDYTELFNTHSANYNTLDNVWDFDPNSEAGCVFFDSEVAGNISNINGANETAYDLHTLFATKPFAGRHALGEADWFYSYDSTTGFYYYDSAKNAASYNQKEQRFYVYDYIATLTDRQSAFLPLNYGAAITKEVANNAFAVKSEIEFFLPYDSGSAENVSIYGTDLQLSFSGKNVLIFIDGQPLMVSANDRGEVNFATGKITDGASVMDLPFVIEGGNAHTLTICYLQNVASFSDYAVYFNVTPAYDLLISVKDSETDESLEGATFRVYDDEACTIPAKLYCVQADGTRILSEEATFSTDSNGMLHCWGLVPGRNYYIREIESSDGYPSVADHVIKILPDKAGKTEILTDSNGTQFVLAEYRVDDNSVILDVFNNRFIGVSKDSPATKGLFDSGNDVRYVEKVWVGETDDLPTEITILLCANGEPTGRTIVLSEENDWKGFWYNLPATDASGSAYNYTVVESDKLDNYYVTYEETTGEISETVEVPGYWQQATSMTGGAEYRIVSNSTGYAVAVTSSSSTSLSPKEPSETDDSQIWVANTSGSGVILTNKAYTNRHLSLSRTSASASTTSSGNNVTITYTNERIKSDSSGYLRDNGTSNFRATSMSSLASKYTVYRWYEPSTETTVKQIPGWRVINTKWDETIDIPVETIWDVTVITSRRKEVKVDLYLVNEADMSAQLVSTLKINENTLWEGSFNDLERPSEGSFYCIVEDSTEYQIGYGANNVRVFIDEKLTRAARVNVGEDGKAEITRITNSYLVILPETGGTGIEWYTLGGLVLMVASMLLLYRHQKRRREDFTSS